MSEIGEVYEALRLERKQESHRRRQEAESEYESARGLAADRGLILIRKSETHYQLTPGGDRWLINLYPGNQRIYADPNRPRAPFLKVPRPWSLSDAVTAVKRGRR